MGKVRMRRLPLIGGAVMAVSFVVGAALAASRYPHPYGPQHGNTLSQLGDPTLNPNGYGFYLAGGAISGLLAIVLFLDLGRWKVSGTRLQNRLLLLVQGLGVLGGIGLLMSALVAGDLPALHYLYAGMLFNCFAAAMLLAIPALWRTGYWNVALLVLGLAPVAGVIAMFVNAAVHWMEWVPVGMFLLFTFLLSVLSRIFKQAP